MADRPLTTREQIEAILAQEPKPTRRHYQRRQPMPRLNPKMEKVLARTFAGERAQSEGFVYFVACGPFLKIGYSAQPRTRVRAMRVTNPYDCQIIGLLNGGLSVEKEVLEQFAAHAHRNEWFHLNDEVRAKVGELCGDWSELDTADGPSLGRQELKRIQEY